VSKEGRKEGRKREKDVVDAELSLPFPSVIIPFPLPTLATDGFTADILHGKKERVECA